MSSFTYGGRMRQGDSNAGAGGGGRVEADDKTKEKQSQKFKLSETLTEMRVQNRKAEDEWHALVKKKILNFMVFLFVPPCLLVFVLGSYDFFKNVEENKCQMTYMFEYPQYVKIPFGEAITHEFPMYRLYAYAEGKHIEPVRNLKFTGIPVLFLPGNAGSYKQVRSLASVALRKWLDNRTPFHFDFFSVDFNEEISGMYGYVLERQSRYVKHVVQNIMSFYEEYHHVVIVGHSMGGIVAKSVNVYEPTVQLIYTMAAPHLNPPLITDPEQDLFYYYVMRNWTAVANKENTGPVTLVSVSGGERDFLVPARLTKWSHNTIHASTTAIPTVWASTDHLCVVWCKQLVMVVIRSLFDLVEYKNKMRYYGITENSTVRNTVLEYHFIKRTSGKCFHSAHPPELEGEKPSSTTSWNEILTHSYCQPSFDNPVYIMVPKLSLEQRIVGSPQEYGILISTTNTKAKNWIFGCKNLETSGNVKYCSSLENLSNQTVLLPSYHRNRKVVNLQANTVTKFSHLVVKMNRVKFKTCLDVDVYKLKDRKTYLGAVINNTEGGIFYNLSYPITFNQSKLFVWNVHVELVKDAAGKKIQCPGHHNSLGIFQHGNFQTHNFFKNESLHIRFSDTSATSGNAILYLDKTCKYSIRVTLDYIGTAGQLFRVCWKFVPTYMASILLMSLFFQPPKNWMNFHLLILDNAYNLSIVPGFIIAFCLAVLPNDYRYMMTEADYSAILPMLCYFISYGLVLIISFGLWLLTLSFGNGLHVIVTKLIGGKLGDLPDKVTDFALTLTLEKFPITVALFIIAVGMSTSGALALAVGFILHILKIFKGYEDILEDLLRGRIKSVSEGLSPINFQMHCALLWMVVATINVPGLVYWIHSFRYGEIPNWDLSLYICLMMSPSVSIFWQGGVPNLHPTMWNIQRYLCYVMGIILVVYGSHRIYLISFITVLILCSLSVCQFISHFAIEEDNTEEGNRDEGGNHHSDPASYQPSSSLRTQRSASNSSLEQHINGTNVKEDLETSSSSTASSSTTDEEEDERK